MSTRANSHKAKTQISQPLERGALGKEFIHNLSSENSDSFNRLPKALVLSLVSNT